MVSKTYNPFIKNKKEACIYLNKIIMIALLLTSNIVLYVKHHTSEIYNQKYNALNIKNRLKDNKKSALTLFSSEETLESYKCKNNSRIIQNMDKSLSFVGFPDSCDLTFDVEESN